jgi:hypothetical protein
MFLYKFELKVASTKAVLAKKKQPSTSKIESGPPKAIAVATPAN